MQAGPGVGDGGVGGTPPAPQQDRLDVALRHLGKVHGQLRVRAGESVQYKAVLRLLLPLRVRLEPVLVNLDNLCMRLG